MNVSKGLNTRTMIVGVGALIVIVFFVMNMTESAEGGTFTFGSSSLLDWVVTLAPWFLLIVAAYGGYKYVGTGSGTVPKGVFSLIAGGLILIAALVLFIGEPLTKELISESQSGASNLAQKVIDGKGVSLNPDNFTIPHVLFNDYGWVGLLLVIVGVMWGKHAWIQGVGGLLILLAIYNSGYFHWTKSVVNRGSEILSCKADPKQSHCVALRHQQALEEAAEYAERVAATQRQAVIQAARTYTPPPPPLTQAGGNSCGGVYKNLKGCKSIVFKRNEKYDHEPPIGHCSAGDGPITGTSLGSGGMMRWLPNAENVVGRVFSLKVGESFGGFTCR